MICAATNFCNVHADTFLIQNGKHLLEICHLEIGVSPTGSILEREQVRTPTPRTFSHDATVLQVRSTTAQEWFVEHLK